jgi:translation initiation factor IF-1|tara:strand:+ start:415 stop:666 length:252 start_codon:yes stop_codon:yes gene_type:complete
VAKKIKKNKDNTASDKGLIEFEGEITNVLPNQTFKVKLENGHEIVAYTNGKLRQFKIRMILGDKVRVEISPYDLSKGRITYRL